MAHKKGEGSTQNGRDSNAKYLGVKLYGGQKANEGSIIIRQRGSKFHLGDNVYMGKDWTIHAKVAGNVKFTKGRRKRTFVHIIPFDQVEERLDVKQEAVKIPVAKTVKAAPAPKVVETPKVEEAPMAAAPKVVETPKVEETPKAAAPAPKKATGGKDDLRKVEGIGPKIASLLNDAGILTFADLAATEASKVKDILVAAGSRYGFHDPTTWPAQAKMAAEGRWEELEKWQDELDGGKAPSSSEEE